MKKCSIIPILIGIFLILPFSTQAMDLSKSVEKIRKTIQRVLVLERLNVHGYIYNKKGRVNIKDSLKVTNAGIFNKNINVKGAIKNTKKDSPVLIEDNLKVENSADFEDTIKITMADQFSTGLRVATGAVEIGEGQLSQSKNMAADEFNHSGVAGSIELTSGTNTKELSGTTGEVILQDGAGSPVAFPDGSVTGVGGRVLINTSENVGDAIGVGAAVITGEVPTIGTVNQAIGMGGVIAHTTGGTINSTIGIGVLPTGNYGGGTINNNFGVLILEQTAGVNDIGVYIQGADTYALYVDDGISRFDGNVGIGIDMPISALQVGQGYIQMDNVPTGAPPVSDCVDDTQIGRMVLDSLNNVLYICNGSARNWDTVALTD